MSHLDSCVTALVDGHLPPWEAEVLLAHAAACERCRVLLAQERAARAALSSARHMEPEPELTARLLALSPSSVEPPRPRRSRRLALVGAGVAAAAGTAAVGLVVVGGLSEPRADPQAILGAVTGHSGDRPAGLPDTRGTADRSDEVVSWMEEHGWSAPSDLPAGMRVVDVEIHRTEMGEILDVEIAGAMAHVRLLQQRGVLAEEDAEDLYGAFAARTVGLSTGVNDIAFQSRDCVVLVISAADDAPLSEQILGALPDDGYDTSVGARLARGWQTLHQWGQD